MKKGTMRQILPLLLALPVLISACGSRTASSIRLQKTEGTVRVSNAKDRKMNARENRRLYDGYGVRTEEESYAWVTLDSVKLTKLDQQSRIGIRKAGKKLKVDVEEGSLFFQITEPLDEDESLYIRTSTLAIGIRGTCGWVENSEDGKTGRVYLLEGEVECTAVNADDGADKQGTLITAGETASLTEGGEIMVETFGADAIPAFVREEAKEDEDLYGMIQEIPTQDSSDDPGDLDDPGNSPVDDTAGSDTLPIPNTIAFCFSSGAGAWATVLELSPDGTFSGSYHDSNAGETGPGYQGTMHVCNFEGKFKDIRQKDEYTYSMTLDYYNTEKPAGEVWIEGVARYVAEEPLGVAGGETFELYLPGKPVTSLTQDFLNGVNWIYNLSQNSTLSAYGFYNVNEGCGFFEN